MTYLLTPRSRVLLEKLTGPQLVKKFPAFYGNRKFITAITSSRHLTVSWASSIQSIPPHPTSWRYILILSSHLRPGLPSGLLMTAYPFKYLFTLHLPRTKSYSFNMKRILLNKALPIAEFIQIFRNKKWKRLLSNSPRFPKECRLLVRLGPSPDRPSGRTTCTVHKDEYGVLVEWNRSTERANCPTPTRAPPSAPNLTQTDEIEGANFVGERRENTARTAQ